MYADPGQPEAFANGKKRLRELREQLKYSVSAPVIRQTQGFPAEREFAKADYLKAVERAKELIADGDFMQVQVGQRIRKRYTESPLSLYRALRSLNPSPYMYYYHFGDFHVVGASPEILVRQEQSRTARQDHHPPAGRHAAARRDAGARQGRWSRSCWPTQGARRARDADRPGAQRHRPHREDRARVKVTEAFAIERYSHVMHIVSNVEGILNDGMTASTCSRPPSRPAR